MQKRFQSLRGISDKTSSKQLFGMETRKRSRDLVDVVAFILMSRNDALRDEATSVRLFISNVTVVAGSDSWIIYDFIVILKNKWERYTCF